MSGTFSKENDIVTTIINFSIDHLSAIVYIIDINFNILGVDVNTVFIRVQMEYELCLQNSML
jgi:hypothetical protein